MQHRTTVLVAGLLALAVLAPGALAAVNRQIPLRGSAAYPAARGSAQYQAQHGQRELQVEVARVPALAGRRVVVFVGGKRFGAATVSRRGVADVGHNTERGQAVPRITGHPLVRARTSGGTLVASGRF